MDYTGTSGGDRQHGTADDDTLRGLEGNDRLWGENGDDVIDGGAGKDSIEGGKGDDLLFGGEGRDRIYGTSDFDTLFGGAGDDILNGGGGGDWLDGGDGDDELHIGAAQAQGDNFVFGGAGNDWFHGEQRGKFGLYLDLGDGADGAYVVRTTRATVVGGAGDDAMIVHTHSGETRKFVGIGGDGDDRFYVPVQPHTEGVRVIRGGRGDDSVTVSNGGTYELALGKGADVIEYLPSGLVAALPERAVWVSDFAAGPGGDDLDLHPVLEKFGGPGWWDGVGDPVAGGRLRLVQDGGDTLVEADFDAGGGDYGWTALVRLAGVDAGDMTAANLHGYDPDQQP